MGGVCECDATVMVERFSRRIEKHGDRALRVPVDTRVAPTPAVPASARTDRQVRRRFAPAQHLSKRLRLR